MSEVPDKRRKKVRDMPVDIVYSLAHPLALFFLIQFSFFSRDVACCAWFTLRDLSPLYSISNRSDLGEIHFALKTPSLSKESPTLQQPIYCSLLRCLQFFIFSGEVGTFQTHSRSAHIFDNTSTTSFSLPKPHTGAHTIATRTGTADGVYFTRLFKS